VQLKDNFMPVENKFSLLDEPWIPIADVGRVSLKQIFTEPTYRALGGNPVQKIAVTKLLLAIAQAACTPEYNYDDWENLSTDELAKNCLAYLKTHHDRFYLYGENPFLQIPAIAKAAIQPIGAVLPEIATGNTTVLNTIQIEKQLDDADKALLILQLMGFGLGGKKTDNTVTLSAGYTGKSKDNGKGTTGKAGASLGYMGFLHSFLQGETLLQTLWLNLFSQEQINELPYDNDDKLGIAPWEKMPEGEACETAKQLQNSLMGRLIPLSRFCLLNETGLHYSEGITYHDYKTGMVDLSVAFSNAEKKVLWVDTERRPWRFLTALLSFMESQLTEKVSKKDGSTKGGFNCYYIRQGIDRMRDIELPMAKIGLWSGGLKVSSNAGEQYVSGSDDFVESITFFNKEDVFNAAWYSALKQEMSMLDELADKVKKSTWHYFKAQNMDGNKQSAAASHLFWQLCERKYQALVLDCKSEEKTKALRKDFARFARTAYNAYCPNNTARQLEAWAKSLPHLGYYLKDVNQKDKDKENA
jgi:CRISPR system Cascade subunit CasA